MLQLLVAASMALVLADPIEEARWKDVTEQFQDGDVTVFVGHARRGIVDLRYFGKDAKSENKLLAVHLFIRNDSQTKKVEYQGWSTKAFTIGDPIGAEAFDELGNLYKRVTFRSEIVGQIQTGESIQPGKTLHDVVIFQLPFSHTKEVRLLLPGEAVGSRKPIRLKFAVGADHGDGIIYDSRREEAAATDAKRRDAGEGQAAAQRQKEIEARKSREQDSVEPATKDAEAKNGDNELADRKPIDAKAKAENDERAAATKMRAANRLLAAGKREGYRNALQEIAETFPATPTGKKAAKLLK